MKFLKKLGLFLFVAIFSLCFFVGCSNQDADIDSGENTTDVTEDDSADTGNEDPDSSDDSETTDDTEDKTGYSIVEMHVRNGENDIYGKLYIPDSNEEKMPSVILSHSANLNADSMNAYAIGFAERGYVAYAFDFCGGSSKSRSTGNTDDMTLFTEISDLKAAVESIAKLSYVDTDRIYVFGSSQGGLVTALAAEELSTLIKGEILLYPAFNIPELIAKFSGFGSFGSFGMGGYGKAFSETLKDYDPYEHIGNFEGNVLIIHGTSDFIVSTSYSERAAEIYKNCALKKIQGAGHGFNSENMSMNGDHDSEVWEYIDEYFLSE